MNALELALRATAPVCGLCSDLRVVAQRTGQSQRCPACGDLNEGAYAERRRTEYARRHAAPEICQLDMTEAEIELLRRWKDLFPEVSKLTFFSWIEGRRYDPSKDQDFVELVRETVAAERAAMPEREISRSTANATRGELYRRFKEKETKWPTAA